MSRIKGVLSISSGHLVAIALVSSGYGLLKGIFWSWRFWADATALVGICYLSAGLFRLVRYSGFFDLTIFGTKKLWEIITTRNYDVRTAKYRDFITYRENNPYYKSAAPIMVTACALLGISLFLILVF